MYSFFWYNNIVDVKIDTSANPNIADTEGSRPLNIVIYQMCPLNVTEDSIDTEKHKVQLHKFMMVLNL